MKTISTSLKVAFAGSGPFAEPIFESMAQQFKDLTLIVKKGTPADSRICQISKKHNIKSFEASNKEELHTEIEKLKPDVVVVVSFGIIISKSTLDMPKHGFINVHYSLLPKYRGPSPVQTAILAGENTSGVTFQKMASAVDEGDILYQEEVDIKPHDTTEALAKRMADISAKKLPEIVNKHINEQVRLMQQTGEPSYSKIIDKSDGKINWSENAEVIERKVRAYTPWPSAYTYWNGKLLKILEADVENIESNGKNGTFYEMDSGPASHQGGSESGMTRLYGIQTGKGVLVVKKVQLEGKKPLKTSDFILGNSQIVGSILG